MSDAAGYAVYEATKVSQAYGATRALIDVDFIMRSGEVHALIGENGAGKSTLAKILSGVMRPQSGTLAVAGEPVDVRSPRDAYRLGIATVAQEFQHYPDLSIAENVFFQHERLRGGVTQKKAMIAGTTAALARVGLTRDPRSLLNTLALAEQQLVAIAAALLQHPKVLILDEPTSALKAAEATRLLQIVRALRDGGVAICYISHNLDDVLSISDRITVLRDGEVVTRGVERSQTSLSVLADELVGHGQARESVAPPAVVQRPLSVVGGSVKVIRLRARPTLHSIDLDVASGEILGLAGVEGSGASTILDAIFGLIPVQSGEVILPKGKWRPGSPWNSVRCGIARVPADRQEEGLMPQATLAANVTAVSAGVLGRNGIFPRRAWIDARTTARMNETRIKAPGPWALTDWLSGGNQQKVVFAKWIESDPQLLLLDDPTRGVDIGAREDMHQIIRRLAERGTAILVASSDLEELTALCDRIAVIRAGRVVASVAREGTATSGLLELMNSSDRRGTAGVRP